MDFEPALHKAWKFVFGDNCQIVGCLFHFKQALCEKARKLRLAIK